MLFKTNRLEGDNLKMRGVLNACQLKLLLVALMILDHVYAYLPGMPDWFTWLGRLAAPTFTYLMVESYLHTSDRMRYIKRLAKAGFVMLAGNIVLSLIFRKTLEQNIFLSLAVSAGLLYYWDKYKEKPRPEYAAVSLIMAALSIFCEGMIMCPVMAVVFRYLHNSRWMYPAYIAASVALCTTLFVDIFPQVLMVFAVVPILLYNGSRGSNGVFARRFFYVVYPVHIWILFAVHQLFFVSG